MTDKTLREVIHITRRLLQVLNLLCISPRELKYDLTFKHYSKHFYGRYHRYKPETGKLPNVSVFIFKNKEKTELYPFEDLVSTLIHEVCHHIQYSQPDFVRRKGVMHDKEFWDLYNAYMSAYLKHSKEKGGKRYEESIRKSIRKGSCPHTDSNQ